MTAGRGTREAGDRPRGQQFARGGILGETRKIGQLNISCVICFTVLGFLYIFLLFYLFILSLGSLKRLFYGVNSLGNFSYG